jgi:hypothetical protein
MERLRISKGALVELIIVTAGVLIALSVDTVRQWRANEALAAQARQNILIEIRQNKERLDSSIKQLHNNRQAYIDTYHAADNVLAGRPHGLEKIQLDNNATNLTEAAYSTAEITGAFGQMAYEDVRRFAGLYGVQRRFSAIEQQFSGIISDATGPLMLVELQKMSPAELDRVKQGLERALGSLTTRAIAGQTLSRAYAATLKEADSD